MRTIVCTIVAMLFLAVLSQAGTAQPMPGGGTGPALQGQEERTLTPEQFSERKAKLLKLIEQRRARLDQEKTCVEAAKTYDELKKCRPEPRGPMGPGGPGQEPPMGGMGGMR